MSKNLSIDNGTNTAQPASWEDAIREAQRMIAEAQDRIKGLKLSLVEFRRLKDKGMPFPGGGDASTQI